MFEASRFLRTAGAMLALAFGIWGAARARLDVFPEFVPAQVDIQTEAPGFSSEQVEELVTKPIENAIDGSPGLTTLRSEPIPGLSVITVSFENGIDLHNARQGVSEKLAELGNELPAGVSLPKLLPGVSAGRRHSLQVRQAPGASQRTVRVEPIIVLGALSVIANDGWQRSQRLR